MSGVHKRGHDALATKITTLIYTNYQPRNCKSSREEFNEQNKLAPDIICDKDNQAFDLTISTQGKYAYKYKQTKYA